MREPVLRRTKEEAAQTREAILDAAEEVFFQRGVSQTSLNQIAAAAQVTRGAIYWHFSNKSDLFRAMQDRAHLPQQEYFKAQAFLELEDPLTALLRFTDETFARFVTDERAKRVFTIILLRCEYVGEMEEALCEHRANEDSMRTHVFAVFEYANRLGLLNRRWTPEAATDAFVCIIVGLLVEWLRNSCEFDLRTVGALSMQGLFASLQKI
ncbi:TetR family transcriptional regulator [Aureimonas fodinaquatilis]|uniref:TetR family transcriptional regulator n=1 Tax=Aureimonas fodinaquatilis TaxID=2565783 RepID=A0A5B0DZX3_9HYPH|nr:TetR family transcriptional regulator [Aureimonas fodinaquatilis]KAA0971100.1 TetR family transcriptional regulator [Aureimonas fodinaquatilis]